MPIRGKLPIATLLVTLTDQTQTVQRPEFQEDVDQWVNKVIKFQRHSSLIFLQSGDHGLDVCVEDDFLRVDNLARVLQFLRTVDFPKLSCR